MTRKYLLKLRPLEPYFFGDENTIRFDNTNSYFVSSLPVPSAMTILGMLRYTILEQNGLLHSDGRYTQEEIQVNTRYVGAGSFRPDTTDQGMIQSISPLFLMDREDHVYIKLPMNHKSSRDLYTPIALGAPIETSFGQIALPAKGDLKAKDLVKEDQYVCVDTGRVRQNVFSDFLKVTNNLSQPTDGFLKKNMKQLESCFCFAGVVELEDNCILRSGICHMGREKSAFALTVEPGFDLEERIRNGWLGKVSAGFQYALGDLILRSPPAYSAFAMANVKICAILPPTAQRPGSPRGRFYTVSCPQAACFTAPRRWSFGAATDSASIKS